MYGLSCSLVSTLCDPMDCSPPGSAVHGIFQARTQEWVAISSCRGFFPPRDETRVSYISCTGWRVLYHYTPIQNKNFKKQTKKNNNSGSRIVTFSRKRKSSVQLPSKQKPFNSPLRKFKMSIYIEEINTL